MVFSSVLPDRSTLAVWCDRRLLFVLCAAGIFHLRVPESSPIGSAVGKIVAHDLDDGKNAQVEYSIVPGDGGTMFDIVTDEHDQEGTVILKKVGLDEAFIFSDSFSEWVYTHSSFSNRMNLV